MNDMEKELWKDICGYEGLYQVSNMGRVQSVVRKSTTKILKLTTSDKGYQRVGLYKNGKLRTANVHRLVAEAFLPNPSNLEQVNHKDENKMNNAVDNLEWCTRSYNCTYGGRMARIHETKVKKGICSDGWARKKRLNDIFNALTSNSLIDPNVLEAYRLEFNQILNQLH